jgi:hypothetical protein
MSRRPAAITQADVARALRAVEQVRYPGVVEITPDGTIRIVPLSQQQLASARGEPEHQLDDDEPFEL